MGQFTHDGVVYEEMPGGQVKVVGYAAQQPSMVVPPNPAKVAEKQREQARQDAADARSQHSQGNADAYLAIARDKIAKDAAKDDPARTPGDITKTGEEYLASLPASVAAQVKALSDGRRAFPTGSALRDPATKELIAAASQYDPSLDAANAATRVATRKKFTSGTTRDNITAINTALGHLGTLSKDAAALNNFGSPMLNTPVNAFENHVLGDPRVSRFDITRHAVVDELEKAFRGSAGTQAGIEEWKASINSSQSPDQLRAAVSKGVELLNSRLESLNQAYSDGMGKSQDPLQLLNPHAQEVFTHLGPNGDGVLPDHAGPQTTPPLIGGASTPGGGGGTATVGPGQSGPNGGPPVAGGGYEGNMATAATGATMKVPDTATGAGMLALVKAGRPFAEADAYAKAQGAAGLTPRAYAEAVAYAKTHPDYNPVSATKEVPTTLGNRIAGGPVGGLLMGASSAGTLGLNDEAAAGIKTIVSGGNYSDNLNEMNARKAIIEGSNPGMNALGNVAGGVGASMLGGPLIGAVAGRLAPVTAALGRAAPIAGDAAYGAAYGAGQDNENRAGGALLGGAMGGAVGGLARSATRGLANVIAPPAGDAAALYANGVFPSIGQRAAMVNGGQGLAGHIGRGINTFEQALQSVPLAGALVTGSRDAARRQYQLGGFNQALGDIGLKLPENIKVGTEPQAFARDAFGRAYDQARQGMQFVPDKQYMGDLNAFAQQLNNGILNPQQAEQVGKVIQNTVGGRLKATGGALPGEAYQKAGTELQTAIDSWGRAPETAPMANAARDYMTIFDNAARRNSHPDSVAMLDAADSGYAKLVRLQQAAKLGGVKKDAGTFNATTLSQADKDMSGGVRSSSWNTGNGLMQDYAEAGKPLVDTLANSGTADRLSTLSLAGLQGGVGTAGGFAGMGGAIAAAPGALAPFAAYAPGIDAIVKRAIAPNAQRLPPALATIGDNIGSYVNDLAPFVGRMAVPGALGWRLGQ